MEANYIPVYQGKQLRILLSENNYNIDDVFNNYLVYSKIGRLKKIVDYWSLKNNIIKSYKTKYSIKANSELSKHLMIVQKEIELLIGIPCLINTILFPKDNTRKKMSFFLNDIEGNKLYCKFAYGQHEIKEILNEKQVYQSSLIKIFDHANIPEYIGNISKKEYTLNLYIYKRINKNPIKLNKNLVLKKYFDNYFEKCSRNYLVDLEVIKKYDIKGLDRHSKEEIMSNICHGDFTAWNISILNNKLYLYDFEEVRGNSPSLVDLINLYITYYYFIKKSDINITKLYNYLLFYYGYKDIKLNILLSLYDISFRSNVLPKIKMEEIISKYLKSSIYNS